jgi:hypothetical protein
MKKGTMTLFETASACQQCVISVIGSHAGEGIEAIFERKKADIEQTGRTFWLVRSPKAKPAQVQGICRTTPTYTMFIEPSTRGGARPTTEEHGAKEYSENRVVWHQFPKDLGPVTGKLDNGAKALVFDMVQTGVGGTMDLWDYGELSDISKPLRFILGCSTVCATRGDTRPYPGRMKSRYRGVVAIARLVAPYCVWVR